MAGSRAASAREPGQIREEAALSDTARAPRTNLAGADDRRARPGTSFDGGCTVRLFRQVELGSVEAVGDNVVAEATWSTRVRSSGVSGNMPANTLCSVRHGKIASLEWFADHDAAVAAARHT
jgi:hypothetical protein